MCYNEYSKESGFVALSCNHRFCKECVKDHITSKIASGTVSKIKCMQFDCDLEYSADDIKDFITEAQLKTYNNIKQDVMVGSNKSLKWCATADCG